MKSSGGVVTAARQEAAAAGVSLLRAGGDAVDAAVATAFALCVTDPANCGLGGYGGFALVDRPSGTTQVNFNTHVPIAFGGSRHRAGASAEALARGRGALVAPPALLAGLFHLHRNFGTCSWKEVIAPSIVLAEGGFVVGPDLSRAAHWALHEPGHASRDLRDLLSPGGTIVDETAQLLQPNLATTLRKVIEAGAEVLRTGEVAEAVLAVARDHGGVLAREDLAQVSPKHCSPASQPFADAIVFGCHPDESGFSVVAEVLGDGRAESWPRVRDGEYARAVAAKLTRAWQRRDSAVTPLAAAATSTVQHTTHLCAADGSGSLVALTMTHGPLWFGSGLMAAGTGVILNCGATLFAVDGATGRRFAQTNLAPIVIGRENGSRIAFGTPGGRKIPAAAATFAVDVLARGDTVAQAIAHPRISVAADGRCEAEMPLAEQIDGCRTIEIDEFFGPASAIERLASGDIRGFTDPRFAGAVEYA